MLDLRLEYEYMKEDIDAAIRRCLEHQQWILGPEVRELEEKVCQYLKVRHAIGVSSGTDALVLALRALAIKVKGREYFDEADEIITTPFTFTASGDACLRVRACPVFVDIDAQTYNIDLAKIREYLKTEGSKVVGIVPVHLYGQPCDMERIMAIAQEYNLFVVEDAAQAFGGRFKNHYLGAIGTAGAFSFFPSKNLGGFGDGGMVVTNDDEIAELVRMLLKHGGKDKYDACHIGYNARLDTLQAAVLLAKIKYIEEFNERRRKIAQFYNSKLWDVKGIVLPHHPSNAYHVYHQYTIRVLDGKRDELRKYLKERGIETMVYYPLPLPKMRVFKDRMKEGGDLKEAERATREVLSLPIEPLASEEDLLLIVKSIREFFKLD